MLHRPWAIRTKTQGAQPANPKGEVQNPKKERGNLGGKFSPQTVCASALGEEGQGVYPRHTHTHRHTLYIKRGGEGTPFLDLNPSRRPSPSSVFLLRLRRSP